MNSQDQFTNNAYFARLAFCMQWDMHELNYKDTWLNRLFCKKYLKRLAFELQTKCQYVERCLSLYNIDKNIEDTVRGIASEAKEVLSTKHKHLLDEEKH